MNNTNLNLLNTVAGFTLLNTSPILDDALIDQLIKLAAAILTAILTNVLIKKKKK